MAISAKVVADSISEEGVRITTFELEYPRFIHAEFMTHRLFSRNAQSSRAVPVEKMLEQIRKNPANPIHWGKNQPGMSAKETSEDPVDTGGWGGFPMGNREYPWHAWDLGACSAADLAERFANAGYHKQIVNRLTEPFAHIKVVCTATEYDNFFWLRRHPDAQPEIQELAEQMWQAREASTPMMLYAGDWHLPYYKDGYYINAGTFDTDSDGHNHILGDAMMISSSCCAQVSYRKLDDSLEKARKIYDMLVESKPVHASPFEHQATPIVYAEEHGVTHTDRKGNHWSANFRGWIQYRQFLPDNTCWIYKG